MSTPSPRTAGPLTGNMLFPSTSGRLSVSRRRRWPTATKAIAVVAVSLIMLMNQQQHFCEASWATARTGRLPVNSNNTPLPVVSSSEATLLTPATDYPPHTMGQAPARKAKAASASATLKAASTRRKEEIAAVDNDLDDGGGGGGGSGDAFASGDTKNRYKIVSMQTHCTRDLFEMQLQLNRGFHGLLYTKDFPLECRVRGDSQRNVTLRVPTSGCGVRVEPHASGGYMELSVKVMLQMERKLRQSMDILRTVRCRMPLNAMGMSLKVVGDGGEEASELRRGREDASFRNGRMRGFEARKEHSKRLKPHHLAVSDDTEQQQHQQEEEEEQEEALAGDQTTLKTSIAANAVPRGHIWLELGDRDGSGAVEVGQPTTLTVRAKVPGTMGVRVVDCAARDGLGESQQQLLDDRGCPIDEQVMPALHTSFRPVEEGWSKPQEDDVLEKIYTATFPAFKFPDRERLHVSCGVQLCKYRCPNVNCSSSDPFILNADTHLDRIEVFNSLAVTAPQIEADGFLRYERHHNMSAEEYPPHVRPLPTEGTLCLSVSKLAISFCILGLIFLIAVIVALCSLIRSRRRCATLGNTTLVHGCALRTNGNRFQQRAEVCTSMFSSSSESAQSARFASKLFMPYYPNAMPYGRVY